MNLTKVSAGEITACCTTMFGGVILEKYISNMVHTTFEKKASFLTEDLDLWYHGGLEDIASTV
jgi:hypothetical protein